MVISPEYGLFLFLFCPHVHKNLLHWSAVYISLLTNVLMCVAVCYEEDFNFDWREHNISIFNVLLFILIYIQMKL